jgi:cyclophilin family peptidyl-prolyl cis-trans isomerase
VQVALRSAVAIANGAQGLPPATASRFRCENAAAVDKLTGWPAETTHCADEGFRWIGLASQAEVLGSSATEPGRRADALAALINAAQGEPHVLASVATAAVALPPGASGGVVRRLARERDPGVLASLLEALVLHVQHASALPIPVRTELLRAPFDQPEGPAVEARVQAIKLAHALHEPSIDRLAAASTLGAIREARQPDASVTPQPLAPVSPPPGPTRLRFDTDAGSFELELHPEMAPRAVEQLLAAARAHRYDGLTFHRVAPGFVTQGGDPRGDGYGGADTPTPTEISFTPFARGVIGVPLAGLDTGGIQMFITLADSPHLDGRYPAVGRVVRGMEVVDGVMIGDRIERVTVIGP